MTEENHESEKEVEVTLPAGTKFRARGYDFLTIGIFIGLTAMVMMQYNHATGAEKFASDANNNARETARAIREMTCIMSLDPEKRLAQIGAPDSYCKRMAN